MRPSQVARYVIAAALSTLAGCTLFVGVTDIDRECGSEEKLCGGRCVRQDSPAYGCTRDLCASCELTNAVPRCSAGACVLDYCLYGFGCRSSTGCSANILFDRNNCGACMNSCPADQSCQDGECVGR